MIVSRSNLLVNKIIAKDKDIPALNNVRLECDGTSVGAARNIVIAVSPVVQEIKDKYPIKESEKCAATINAEHIKKALSLLPVDKTFSGLLEHVDVSKGEVGQVKLKFTDGKRTSSINCKEYKHEYVPWKEIIKRTVKSGIKNSIVLNRARLKLLLETIEKIIPDTGGDSPIMIEFTNDNDLLVRAINSNNGQRVLATMTNYKGNTAQLKFTEWEKEIIENEVDRKIGTTIIKSKAKRIRGKGVVQKSGVKKKAKRLRRDVG
jgi:hypothetical protein